MVEALLSVWYINYHGQLYKQEEINFNIQDFKVERSDDIKMKLQLSNDKRYCVLPIIEVDNKENKQSAQLLAWSA